MVMMDWYQIKKHIYYTNDDYVRDIIAFHLKRGAMTQVQHRTAIPSAGVA